MKKVFGLLTAAVMALSLFGCRATDTTRIANVPYGVTRGVRRATTLPAATPVPRAATRRSTTARTAPARTTPAYPYVPVWPYGNAITPTPTPAITGALPRTTGTLRTPRAGFVPGNGNATLTNPAIVY
ncbi:MAG: hypothetical protein LBN99_03765 [Oscillospiraceae bacterium]|jgi:hypothetical protein|nr:hypothetical protein [Oscillospiraceae bacterium]